MTQLSVIIQTECWSEQLRTTLESLADQTLDHTVFDAVLTGSSAEGMDEELAHMKLPYSCKVVKLAGCCSGEALNRAVEVADGSYCLFLKEDQIAAPGLLAEHLQVQLETGGVMGIGMVVFNPSPGSSWYAKQSCGWQNRQAAALVKDESQLTWINCSNINFCASRQAILAAGIISKDLCDRAELEIAFRLVRHGLRCVYIPGAVCTLVENRGFTAIARDTVQRGAAYVNLWSRQPAMLPELFGNFYDTSLRGILLRRFLLWLTLSPIFLAVIGPLVQKSAWASEWFKFVQSYCFWYGVKRALSDRSIWRRLTYGTPILMYHAIGSESERVSRYILPLRRFTQQMALLKILGYQTITLEEYLESLITYRLVPERSLVITMDDGYMDNFELAFPVLRRFGFKATIYIVNDGMGSHNSWDKGSPLTGRPVMTAYQARELLRAGITLGSHTCTHPTLTELSTSSWDEIYNSKVELEREFGATVQTFAYPHGKYNPSILEQVKRAGYLGACSVERGLNTPAAPQFALYRTEILGSSSLLQFLISVWSG